MLSVTDWGARGDGSTDDTAAFAAVLDAAGPDKYGRYDRVLVPPGKYMVHEIPWNGKVSLEGTEMNQAQLFYNGAGGAGSCVIDLNAPGPGALAWAGIKGLGVHGQDSAESAVLNTGGAGYDIGFHFARCNFDRFTGDALALQAGEVVNLHLDTVRFDHVAGYCLRLAGSSTTENRPVSINRFTWGGGVAGQGFLRVTDGRGLMIALRDGRIELPLGLLNDPSGTTKSVIYSDNSLSGTICHLRLDNVGGYGKSGDSAVVVHAPSARTAVVASQVNFTAFANPGLLKTTSGTYGAGSVAAQTFVRANNDGIAAL